MASSISILNTNCKRDQYCWTCHMEGPLLKCKSCPRVYHRKCCELMGSGFPQPTFDPQAANPNIMLECPECIRATETCLSTLKNISKADLRTIFMSVSRNLRDGYFWPNPFYHLDFGKDSHYSDLVAKVVDIFRLESLASDGQFQTVEGFMAETKWILHNTVVFHGRCSKESDWATELLNVCKVELMAVSLCPECYLKEQDKEKDPLWFVKPCPAQPHLLGWAKTSSSSYKPVKIMRWTGDKITVRSFSDYKRFSLNPKDCFLFSKNPPKDSTNARKDDHMRRAMIEITAHMKELRKVVGALELAGDDCCLKDLSEEEAILMTFADRNKTEKKSGITKESNHIVW